MFTFTGIYCLGFVLQFICSTDWAKFNKLKLASFCSDNIMKCKMILSYELVIELYILKNSKFRSLEVFKIILNSLVEI